MTSNNNFSSISGVSFRLEVSRKDRFKVLLRRKGISQNKLASGCGVSKGTMSKIVNGFWFPASDLMTKICNILEVPSHVLFGDSSHWKHYNPKIIYVQEKVEVEK